MLIAHIADVHYRGLHRHEEYRTVFEDFVRDVKLQGAEHIFVGGDIFHTKTSGISPEYIEELTWWLRTLADAGILHLTLGNHDGNLKNVDRQDAISPVVKALSHPRIKLYKNSGVYEFEKGWNWCIFSLFDKERWESVRPQKGSVNIACYHGPVVGAKTDTDWEIDDGVRMDFFKGYDYGLLGDIHRMQFLDKAGRIAYPGSTVQQNYAEGTKHGYLLWNIEDKKKFEVEFRELVNPCPFITLPWQGTIKETLELVDLQGVGPGRFCIKGKDMTHQDAVVLTRKLRNEKGAVEVIFRNDRSVSRSISGVAEEDLERDDLRNPAVVMRLMQTFYKDANLGAAMWEELTTLVKGYLEKAADDVYVRNVNWSVKSLKFDNTFNYGEGNVVDFSKLNGLVGIFAPNRTGKSGIVGTLLYTLFNATDRGKVKNLQMCNLRKDTCCGEAVLSIVGKEHRILRNTIKRQTKQGLTASTTLSFELLGSKDEDLGGLERKDTEKEIRSLIGTSDDFLMTSVSAQGDSAQFIGFGSTRRNQILVKFLDLDIFHRMHAVANEDLKTAKAQLKLTPDKDWSVLTMAQEEELKRIKSRKQEVSEELPRVRGSIERFTTELARATGTKPVSQGQVDEQDIRVRKIREKIVAKDDFVRDVQAKISKASANVVEIQRICKEHNLQALRRKRDDLRNVQAEVTRLQDNVAAEEKTLTSSKRSILILSEVPCGDQFPTCKFIKDAHHVKSGIVDQEDKVAVAKATLADAVRKAAKAELKDLDERIRKVEALKGKETELKVRESTLLTDKQKSESEKTALEESLASAEQVLEELKKALDVAASAEVASIGTQLRDLQAKRDGLEGELYTLGQKEGRAGSVIESLAREKAVRDGLLASWHKHELVATAFSRKGVPSVILGTQLPVINVEVANILSGIVDFTVEMEKPEDEDDIDVYINYAGERYPVELGSGMEKFIASIAIRVALINISALPKTDMFIIDEGFGSLDPAGLECVGTMLSSLKRYFRLIIVITHIESIKDVVDDVIEVSKDGKDARVVYD